MATVIRGKLKASSLIESIIAILVITLVFGISLGIIQNVSSNRVLKKEKANRLIEQHLEKALRSETVLNTTQKIDDLEIRTRSSLSNEFPGLLIIKISAHTANGKLINSKTRIVPHEEN